MSEQRAASGMAQGLVMGGGIAWIYSLFVAFSAVTGMRFELGGGGGRSRGVPLPTTWLDFGVFVAVGALLWFGGRRWDAPGFVALRKRRPWLAPVVGVFVVFPATIVLLFFLVR